jgi:hypothetical protein
MVLLKNPALRSSPAHQLCLFYRQEKCMLYRRNV